MGGRKDFSIIYASAVTDGRVLRAADLYVERGVAKEETALMVVLGHIACIALWASRETIDGVIPGDGIAVVRAATICSRKIATVIADVLTSPEVDLLTRDGNPANPLRQRGFKDAYNPIIERRKKDSDKKEQRRRKDSGDGDQVPRDVPGDIPPTGGGTSLPMSGRTGPNRTEPDRTESPPEGPTAGGSSASPSDDTAPDTASDQGPAPKPLHRDDAAVLDAILRRCRNGNFGTLEQRARASKLAEARRTGTLDPDDARRLIDELQNSTPEMTADANRIRATGTMTDRARERR